VRKDLGVPQLEVFHVFTMHRAKVLAWLKVGVHVTGSVLGSACLILRMYALRFTG
jgi:hypothetical protein